MQLGDLLVKLAKGETLTPLELDFIRNAGNQTQQTNAKMAELVGADGKMKLVSPYISNPLWDGSPLAAYKITKSNQQNFPALATTNVAWDFDKSGKSRYFQVDPDDTTKIRTQKNDLNFYLHGYINCAATVNGTVQIAVFVYSTLSTYSEIIVQQTVPASGWLRFSGPFDVPGTGYFQIGIYHNSTGSATYNMGYPCQFFINLI